MDETRLVTPDAIEDRLVATLRRRHPEHLAKLERQLRLKPRTLARLRTISTFGDEGARGASDSPGAVLLGVVGTADAPSLNERGVYDVRLVVGVEVYVGGHGRRDTLRRRDWLSWTVAECLLQRVPRDELVGGIDLLDWEPQDAMNGDRVRAVAAMTLAVEVPSMIAKHGLPSTDSEWPEGGPGGAPARPYDPPVPLPRAALVTYSFARARVTD